jgi:hypothetical protein
MSITPVRRPTDLPVPATKHHIRHDFQGSPKMHSMYEALARDRMRDSEQRSAAARLSRSLAAQRRWHRVSLRAQAAEKRHAQRVSQVTVAG